ncbi:PA3496 family putative envelope integrity protein [Pseudoalteromonas sp. SSDWG2]|uniref:PA3496 family putative envelope integrity protein n=1 Tax=Pseudoalteromonas sp. SSDWG2 TaxID=3139391 RepID=UPI003BA92A2D
MGKTYSYDAFEDEFVEDEYEAMGRNQNDRRKRKVKKKLDDYLEQRRLRKNLGDDDFDDYLNEE